MDVEYEVVETGGAAGVEIGINSGCNTRDCGNGGIDATEYSLGPGVVTTMSAASVTDLTQTLVHRTATTSSGSTAMKTMRFLTRKSTFACMTDHSPV